MSAGALSYVLKLDAGGFLNPMRAAKGALSGLLSTGSQIGNVATGLGSAKDLLGSIIDILKQPITLAADMESLNAEFGVMLGSGAKARKLLSDIQSFANETPFDTAGLAANAKTLLAFGASGDEVVPILKTLGDVAGVSSEKLDQLTLAFAQISSTGKLQGQDLLQLINAGFNPLQEISRTTGRSMGDLKDDMEKGSISAKMVADAFKSATSAGGRFFGNTAAQSRTFLGILSTMKDAAATLWRTLGAPIADALKPVFKDATKLLGDMIPLAKNFGDFLANGITTFLAILKGGNLGKVLTLSLSIGFKEAVNAFVATWTAGTQSFGPLIQKTLGIAIGFLGAALPSLGNALVGGIKLALAGIGKGIAVIMEAFSDPKTMEGFKMAFLSVVSAIKAELLDTFGKVVEFIPGMGERGKSLQADANSARGLSNAQGIQAGLLFGQSNSRIGQAMGGIANAIPENAFDFTAAFKTISGAGADAAKQFGQAYAAAPKVFDTTKDRAALGGTIAADVRKLTAKPIPVQIINQLGQNVGAVF